MCCVGLVLGFGVRRFLTAELRPGEGDVWTGGLSCDSAHAMLCWVTWAFREAGCPGLSQWLCCSQVPNRRGYAAHKAQPGLLGAALGVCPATHCRHLPWGWRQVSAALPLCGAEKESTKPVPRHVVVLAQRSWSQDKWSGFTWKMGSGEVCLHVMDQNLGPAYTSSPFLPAILSSQADCCRFCLESLWVRVWHSVFFPLPGASLSLQTNAGLAAPLPLHPGAYKVQRGGSFQESRCAQPAAAELSYQGLDLEGIKCWTQVHLKSWECFTKLYAYDSINQLAPGQPLQLYIKGMCTGQEGRFLFRLLSGR